MFERRRKKRKKKDFSLKWYSRDISKQKEEEIEEIDESRLREKVFCAINDSRSRENEERSKSVSVSNWSMVKQNSIFSGREKLGDR